MTPETAASGFRHFHDQLAMLKNRLLTMSQIAEQRTELAVDALLNRDAEKAEQVIEGDVELNNLEVESNDSASSSSRCSSRWREISASSSAPLRFRAIWNGLATTR